MYVYIYIYGEAEVGLLLWVLKPEFILVLLINYCIISMQTTVNLLSPHLYIKEKKRKT